MVLAVWKHHISNLQEQLFPEVLIVRSIGPLVTTAFAARATWEADSTCPAALPTAKAQLLQRERDERLIHSFSVCSFI